MQLVCYTQKHSYKQIIDMFDEEAGLRKSDYMESTGMSELKVAYDDLNRFRIISNFMGKSKRSLKIRV